MTVLEFLRRKHGKLTSVVTAVDRSFREQLFLHFLLGIPMIIFTMFVLFTAPPVGVVGQKGTIVLFAVMVILEMFVLWLASLNVYIWVINRRRKTDF